MKFFSFFVFANAINMVFAQDVPPEQIEAKAVMNQVYESFIKIIPYVYSDKLVFDRDKNSSADELTKNLTEISQAFKSAKHIKFLKAPGFKPSLDTINSHIQETIDSLESKNKVFAHARLKAMTALCISCHSQLSPTVSQNAFTATSFQVPRERFDSDYAYANYLYLVRRFPDAAKYFELAIKNSIEKNQKTTSGVVLDDKIVNGEIYTSLRKILSIYTKISFEPNKAIILFKNFSNNKSLSRLTKQDIDLWIKALEKWKKVDVNKISSVDDFINTNLKELESLKAKVNTGDYDVTLLIASGVLSKILNDNPQTATTPQILYWLSIAERRLSTTYFFSLSDIYLKECIIQFPKSEYAKKCYQEYEDNILFGYTGSAGVDLPADEKKELDRLKSFLK